MKFHLDEDGSIGKECEENNANHGEAPNFQGGEGCNKNEQFVSRFFVKAGHIWCIFFAPPLAFGVSLITPLKIPI